MGPVYPGNPERLRIIWPLMPSDRLSPFPPDPGPRLEVLREQGRRARRYGRRCERATRFLLWLKGWDPVAWNLTCGRFEMDLLLTRGDELRLVEVKARATGAWVAADAALGFPQRLRLQRALRILLDRVPWPGRLSFQRVSWRGWEWRFHPPEDWGALTLRQAWGDEPGP